MLIFKVVSEGTQAEWKILFQLTLLGVGQGEVKGREQDTEMPLLPRMAARNHQQTQPSPASLLPGWGRRLSSATTILKPTSCLFPPQILQAHSQ